MFLFFVKSNNKRGVFENSFFKNWVNFADIFKMWSGSALDRTAGTVFLFRDFEIPFVFICDRW